MGISWECITCRYHDPWVLQLAQGSLSFLKPEKLPGNIGRKWLWYLYLVAGSLSLCGLPECYSTFISTPVSYYLHNAEHFGNIARQNEKQKTKNGYLSGNFRETTVWAYLIYVYTCLYYVPAYVYTTHTIFYKISQAMYSFHNLLLLHSG